MWAMPFFSLAFTAEKDLCKVKLRIMLKPLFWKLEGSIKRIDRLLFFKKDWGMYLYTACWDCVITEQKLCWMIFSLTLCLQNYKRPQKVLVGNASLSISISFISLSSIIFITLQESIWRTFHHFSWCDEFIICTIYLISILNIRVNANYLHLCFMNVNWNVLLLT